MKAAPPFRQQTQIPDMGVGIACLHPMFETPFFTLVGFMSNAFTAYERDTLYFVPLGGASEFGGNFNLYHWNGQWLIIDCGIAFENQGAGEVQIRLPDPSYIEQFRDKITGLVITHAHEDHVGAVCALWPRLRCPVYATPFVAAYLARKLEDFPEAEGMSIHRVYPEDRFALGVFNLRMIPTQHSIPEACMVEIETPAGRIIHTGDWKIDYAPLIGNPTNERLFEEIGNSGVLAAITDSTNSTTPGHSGDELDVREGLTELFSRLPHRIIVTCIARNTGRIRAIAEAALANGRKVALAGRSLWTFEHIARDLGYLDHLPAFITPRKANKLPPNEVVTIVTGNQGETNAVLSRMSVGEYRDIQLRRGDHVVFSARIIPDCEEAVLSLQKRLRAAGAEVITPENTPEFIYASGHPSEKDVLQMYQWLKPQILIPVHGETRHLEANAKLAETYGIPSVIAPRTGGVVKITKSGAELVGHVPTGHLVPVNW